MNAKGQIKPSIPADEVTPDTIKSGLIVRLGLGEVFWKLDSGKVELNAFTGQLTARVAGEKLTELEVQFVLNGIRTGRIIVVDKHEKVEPVNTKWLLSEYAPRARRLLDYPDEQFTEVANRTYSMNVLQTALEIEKENKNREGRIRILSTKILEIKKG